MNKLLELTEEELELVINNTADKLKLSKGIVEKDFWVCVILKYLFSSFKYKDSIVFKGGTSLSKVYKLIERFSEDIDLALDWTLLGYDKTEPYEDRSNTNQLKFNQKLNSETEIFLQEQWLPILRNDFNILLKNRKFNFYIDEFDKQTICFDYPKMHKDPSILQVIRLEIGCLAEPIPASNQIIKSYIEEVYSDIFNENINVVAVNSLRTFYEKLTILHREANRMNGNFPIRYSRHYYDIYKMLLTSVKHESFDRLELLKEVTEFKKKFYACNWAKYDEIWDGNLKLIPSEEALLIFSKDYDSMKNMLFGEKVEFDRIIEFLKAYEMELNNVIKNN